MLQGCATTPSGVGGAGAPSTSALSTLPDAVPRVEPIRQGGPNKPYEVFGRYYEPAATDLPWKEEGLASWYGPNFQGHRTSSGEIYNMYGMSAAHKTLPIPSYIRVRNLDNGREVIVRVNDRGPFHSKRILDLSYAAAVKLGIVAQGTAPVEIQRLTFDDIRTGSWRDDSTRLAQAAPPPVATSPPLAVPVSQAVQATPVVPSTLAQSPLVSSQGAAGEGADTAGAGSSMSAADPAAASSPSPPPPAALAASDDALGRFLAQRRPARPDATDDVASATQTGAAAQVASADTRDDAQAGAEHSAGAVVAADASSATETAPADDVARAYTPPGRGFWVQLGAFARSDGARQCHERAVGALSWLAPLLTVFHESSLFRVQAGPYASREQASRVAARVRQALSLAPMIVERR
jgi:rare lipoprotein A